jgi:hypothetical protein
MLGLFPLGEEKPTIRKKYFDYNSCSETCDVYYYSPVLNFLSKINLLDICRWEELEAVGSEWHKEMICMLPRSFFENQRRYSLRCQVCYLLIS